MKKKALKTAAFLVAAALVIGLCLFANGLVGNPISKMLATRTAEKHLAEHYTGTDFHIESIGFNFKCTDYYAHIKPPSSMDSHFSLSISMSGELTWDSYEDHVLSGWNTEDRLNSDYRKLTDTVLESPSFPYTCHIAFGDLIFTNRVDAMDETMPPNALVTEDLVVDQIYDIRKLGEQAGQLVIYIDDQTVTVEHASEMMLHIKELMDDAGIPFYSMDFVLQYPLPDDDTPRPEGQIETLAFPYSDIYEEGMVDRVRAANEAAKAYYAAQDAEKDLFMKEYASQS